MDHSNHVPAGIFEVISHPGGSGVVYCMRSAAAGYCLYTSRNPASEAPILRQYRNPRNVSNRFHHPVKNANSLIGLQLDIEQKCRHMAHRTLRHIPGARAGNVPGRIHKNSMHQHTKNNCRYEAGYLSGVLGLMITEHARDIKQLQFCPPFGKCSRDRKLDSRVWLTKSAPKMINHPDEMNIGNHDRALGFPMVNQ